MNTCIIYIGVMNLNATTDAAIIVMWDPANSPSDCGPIFYYDVTVRSLDDGIIRSTQRTSQTTAQFSNLLNGTDYNISVAAVNRAGSGPSSTINVTGNAIGTYINNVKG